MSASVGFGHSSGVRASDCTGKKAYNTKGDALTATKRRSRASVIYRCQFCHKWHIGGSK